MDSLDISLLILARFFEAPNTFLRSQILSSGDGDEKEEKLNAVRRKNGKAKNVNGIEEEMPKQAC